MMCSLTCQACSKRPVKSSGYSYNILILKAVPGRTLQALGFSGLKVHTLALLWKNHQNCKPRKKWNDLIKTLGKYKFMKLNLTLMILGRRKEEPIPAFHPAYPAGSWGGQAMVRHGLKRALTWVGPVLLTLSFPPKILLLTWGWGVQCVVRRLSGPSHMCCTACSGQDPRELSAIASHPKRDVISWDRPNPLCSLKTKPKDISSNHLQPWHSWIWEAVTPLQVWRMFCSQASLADPCSGPLLMPSPHPRVPSCFFPTSLASSIFQGSVRSMPEVFIQPLAPLKSPAVTLLGHLLHLASIITLTSVTCLPTRSLSCSSTMPIHSLNGLRMLCYESCRPLVSMCGLKDLIPRAMKWPSNAQRTFRAKMKFMWYCMFGKSLFVFLVEMAYDILLSLKLCCFLPRLLYLCSPCVNE